MSAALHLPPEDEAAPRVEAAAFVLALRGAGVADLAVLRAMETVPREFFAPRRYGDLARSNVALPLPCGQTMTAPASVGLMLAALAVRPGHRVLEVGSGSGYVTALLSRMGACVQSSERDPVLAESAGSRLAAFGLAAAVDLRCRDGLAPAQAESRFDRILLNGSIKSLSPLLTSRLAAGGRLVCGHSAPDGGRLILLARDLDGRLSHGVLGRLRLSGLVEAETTAPSSAAETEV